MRQGICRNHRIMELHYRKMTFLCQLLEQWIGRRCQIQELGKLANAVDCGRDTFFHDRFALHMILTYGDVSLPSIPFPGIRLTGLWLQAEVLSASYLHACRSVSSGLLCCGMAEVNFPSQAGRFAIDVH